ncbi:MAG: argininosuccinate lyase [Nitrospinae bacterium]|nr:argininosuccinate lyase [Nitrospinota bacterium]
MTVKKPWEGRFKEQTSSKTEFFTESISFDKALYPYDIQGSIAHVTMLAQCKILSDDDAQKIISGLNEVKNELEEGNFTFNSSDEDIHMAIEGRLTQIVGDVGGKLHTGRSRNDQVAVDTRLYVKDILNETDKLLEKLLATLVKVARENIDVIFPGKTHLQAAQPVLFSHHMLAYYEMFRRDRERFSDLMKRVDVMPLGSAALAGTPHPIDRFITAKLLGFSKVSENSMDSVSDRDYLIEFCSASAIFMMHCSRLSEELILWVTSEYNYISLSDAHCTGSSIMPQKKNPDVPEIIRGKTGRVYGNLINLLTMMKSMPMAYNRDMQEDKEPLFDTAKTLLGVLDILPDILEGMKVNREKLKGISEEGFPTATDIADYLVKKNLPFRDAHHIVGKIVAEAEKQKCYLKDLPLNILKSYSDLIEEDIYPFLTVEGSINSKASYGSTAKEMVLKRLQEL